MLEIDCRANGGHISVISFFSGKLFVAEFAIAYSRTITDRLSVGVKVAYIKSELVSPEYDSSVNAPGLLSLQLGGTFKLSEQSKLGFAITNLGYEYSYIDGGVNHRLPTYVSVGYFTHIMETETGYLTGNVELKKGYHDDFDNGEFIGGNLIYTYQNLIDFTLLYLA